MSYEAVLEQVRATPEEYLDEISSIISLMVHRRKQEEETAKSHDAFFSLAGKMQQSPKRDFRKYVGAVSKDDSDLVARAVEDGHLDSNL